MSDIIKTNYKSMYNRLNSNEKKLKKIINTNIRFMLICIKDIDRLIWDERETMPIITKYDYLGQKFGYSKSIEMLQGILVDMMKLRMWGEA